MPKKKNKGSTRGSHADSTTPTRSRPRPRESKVIGSSCTWRADELQEFKVSYTNPEVDVKSLFDNPEKWFDFSDLQHYEKGINSSSHLRISLIQKRETNCFR